MTFNRRVAVTGTPQVALTVGAQTRQADYASGTGTYTLTFHYTVVAADADADGIEHRRERVGAEQRDAQRRPRRHDCGGVWDWAAMRLSAAAGHKVDGTLAGASVTGVAVSSTPESGDNVRPGRADRGSGDVRPCGDGDGRAAAGADGGHDDAAGELRSAAAARRRCRSRTACRARAVAGAGRAAWTRTPTAWAWQLPR